jgi:hypothetical protein
MKSILICIIFSSLLISCNHKSEEILKFESYLPQNDLLVLNEWVNLFDEVIRNSYHHDNGQNIKSLMEDILKEDIDKWKLDKAATCELIQKFDSSTLELRSRKLKYDTVYSSNSYKLWDSTYYSKEPMIVTVTQDQDTSWGDIMIAGIESLEETIEYLENDGYFDTINKSSFTKALDSLNLINPNIKNYLSNKKHLAYLNYKVVAVTSLELDKSELDNKLIKRIIIFEAFVNYIKKEYGC